MAEIPAEFQALITTLVPLDGLDAEVRDRLVAGGAFLSYRRGQHLFREGDRDAFTFYLLEGELELTSGGALAKRVVGGQEGARTALAQLQPRQLSARARTPVTVLRLERAELERLARRGEVQAEADGVIEVADIESAGEEEADWMTAMLRSPLFAQMPVTNIQQVFTRMEPVEVPAGAVVVQQGAPGDYYYALVRGRAEVVRRPSGGGQPVKLAELAAGDCFGEEALVSGAMRNATVRMLTDGALMRMSKQDFVELVKKPTLRVLSARQAGETVAAGGAWLDVRGPDEYALAHLEGSVNLPVNVVRSRAASLAQGRCYVAYCDDGRRSAAAAFLLAGLGIEAAYLAGGLVSNPALCPAALPAGARAAADRSPGATALDDVVKVSALDAKLARAGMQVNQAQRLRDAARSATTGAASGDARALREERERLRAEAKRAERALAEANRIKRELEVAKRKAVEETQRRHREEEQRLQRLTAETEGRLREEKSRLEAEYARNADTLNRIRRLRAETEGRLREEKERLDRQAEEARLKLEQASALQARMEAERQRLEHDALAQRQRQEAEAQRNIAQQRARLEQEADARLREAREQLAKEAEEARRRLEEATRLKQQMEAERERMRREADERAEAERQRLEQEAAQRLHEERERVTREAEEARQRLEEAARLKREVEVERDRVLHEASERAETARLHAEQEAERRLREQRERVERETLERAAQEAEQRLGEEKVRIERESQERAAQEAEQRLSVERARLEREAEEAHRRLEEANRLKQEMEAERERLEREATEHAEAVRRRMEEEADERLREERERIERQAEEAIRIKEQMEAERARLEAETQRRLQEQEEMEQRVREEAMRRIGEERQRLEAEFARSAAELERARQEREAAEAARAAAAEEAQRIIAEQRAEQDKRYREAEAQLAEERERLQHEAQRIHAAMEEAQRARAEAERVRGEAARKLDALKASQRKARQAPAHPDEQQLRKQIRKAEAAATRADEELQAARRIERDAAAQQVRNAHALAEKQSEVEEIHQQMLAEMEEWLHDHELTESSEDSLLAKAAEERDRERIRRSAQQARAAADAHNTSLFDDIAAMLRDQDD